MLGLAGCSGPQSALDPLGPSAAAAASLWWGMLGFFTLVWVAVVALWLYALRRKTPANDDAHARRIGRRWLVGGGLLLPGITVAVLLALGIPVGHRMLPLPPADGEPLVIEVIGHRWWWEVRYPGTGVVTANQLVLPAGRPVDVRVSSADVIHSFWIPRLAGKIDMIPGRVNVLRLEADRPARLRGQCAEFCGTQHARMALSVEALEPAAFEAWLAAREALRRDPPPHAAAAETFGTYCARCHRVAGVSEGRGGPDLTDVGTRPTLGAGTLPRAPGAVSEWLHGHQLLKPGNRMPNHGHIRPETLDAIADWLETLGT